IGQWQFIMIRWEQSKTHVFLNGQLFGSIDRLVNSIRGVRLWGGAATVSTVGGEQFSIFYPSFMLYALNPWRKIRIETQIGHKIYLPNNWPDTDPLPDSMVDSFKTVPFEVQLGITAILIWSFS